MAFYLHLYSHSSTANESKNNIKPTLQFCLYVVSGHLWIVFNYLLRWREEGKQILLSPSCCLGQTEVTKLQNTTAIKQDLEKIKRCPLFVLLKLVQHTSSFIHHQTLDGFRYDTTIPDLWMCLSPWTKSHPNLLTDPSGHPLSCSINDCREPPNIGQRRQSVEQ